MKKPVLVLNKGWFPINAEKSWTDVFTKICSGAFYPVDISYSVNEDGLIDLEKMEQLNAIRSFKDWSELEIRPYDEYVTTPKKIVRMPSLVICANFNEITKKKIQFPTKSNIWKRDNYTCIYTGEKLTRDELSIDHAQPSSRGGENSWTNLVTCKKSLNVWKGNRTPKECGLKFLWTPSKPVDGYSFDFMRKEWEMFLSGGDFESS